jgi:hypothetical protein
MLESIRIEGFRGIASLSIDDFSTVNIFVGSNGVGKTSVLEACALAADPLSPQLISAFSTWRELPPISKETDDGFRALFPGLNTHSHITISYRTTGGERRLMITGLHSSTSEIIRTSSGSASAPLADSDALAGIQLVLNSGAGPQQSTMTCMLQDRGINVQVKSSAKRELGSFYIHGRRSTSAAETAALVTRLYERKRESPFIATLQRIDPRIKRLQPGLRRNAPIVLADLGGEFMVPINLLGDGFNRICLILTGILWDVTRVTVVDEIDSGLHHSIMTKFWEDAARMLKEMNHQLFCATHSDEMLMKSLDAFEKQQDALRVFRLERRNNELGIRRYTYRDYKRAVMEGEEVR